MYLRSMIGIGLFCVFTGRTLMAQSPKGGSWRWSANATAMSGAVPLPQLALGFDASVRVLKSRWLDLRPEASVVPFLLKTRSVRTFLAPGGPSDDRQVGRMASLGMVSTLGLESRRLYIVAGTG
jgi:hypothetical protein